MSLTTFFSSRKWALSLCCILVLAFGVFLRIFDLSAVPAGLWFDEGINGLDAVQTVQADGGYELFYIRNNNAREPLYIWYLAQFYGPLSPFKRLLSPVTLLRFANSCLNLFACLLMGILFYQYKPHLSRHHIWFILAVFLMLFLRWNIHLSHIAFRTQMFLVTLSASMIAWMIWIDKKQNRYLVLTGVLAGLTFYTYIAARIVPLVFLFQLIVVRKQYCISDIVKDCLLFAVPYLIVISPLAAYFLSHPGHFTWRMKEVSILAQSEQPVRDILMNILKGLRGIVWSGDTVIQHNYHQYPIFRFPFSLFFLMGLYRAVINRKYILINPFIWILSGIGITALSQNAPNFVRMLFILPFTVMFLAYGMTESYEWCRKKWRYSMAVFCVLCAFFLYQNVSDFYLWARDPSTKQKFNIDTVNIYRYANKFSKKMDIFVYSPIYNHPSFQYMYGFHNFSKNHEIHSDKGEYQPDEYGVFQFNPRRKQPNTRIKQISEIKNHQGNTWIYFVIYQKEKSS